MNKQSNSRVAFALILALVFLTAFTACTQAPGEISPTPEPPVIEVTPPAEQIPEIPDETEVPSFEEPVGFDEAEIEALNRMHAVYDSYVRALSATGTKVSDSSDPIFFWTVLNYMCANYAKLHPLAEKMDTRYMLPGSALREFADACFFSIEELPELPPQTFDITYDAEADQYFIGMMEGGDEYAEKIDYIRGADGNPEAIIAWLNAGQGGANMLGAYFFNLVPNENAGAVEPLFEYSVTSVREGFTDIVRVKSVYEREGAQYAMVDMVELSQGAMPEPSALEPLELDLTQGGLSFTSDSTPVVVDEDVELIIAEGAEFTFNGIVRFFPEAERDLTAMSARDFFIQYAAREANGEHLYFNVNVLEGAIYGGALMS